MESLSWIVYCVVAVGAMIWIGLMVMSLGFDRLGISHFIGLLVTFFAASMGMALGALSPLAVLGALLAAPFVLIGIEQFHQHQDEMLQRSLLMDEIGRARAFLKEHAEDPFPYVQMAEIYDKLGEHALAAQFYDRAAASAQKDPAAADAYEHKARVARTWKRQRELSRDPICAAFCACLHCGDVIARRAASCPACGRSNFPGGMARFVALLREFLEGSLFQSVVIAGMVSLPFLFILGRMPHDALWGLLSTAFWLSGQGQKAEG